MSWGVARSPGNQCGTAIEDDSRSCPVVVGAPALLSRAPTRPRLGGRHWVVEGTAVGVACWL